MEGLYFIMVTQLRDYQEETGEEKHPKATACDTRRLTKVPRNELMRRASQAPRDGFTRSALKGPHSLSIWGYNAALPLTLPITVFSQLCVYVGPLIQGAAVTPPPPAPLDSCGEQAGHSGGGDAPNCRASASD